MSSVRTKLDSYKLLPKWIRYLSSYLNLLLCSVLLKPKIYGRKKIPQNGPYIVAINHFHIFDPALVAYAIRKPISFLAASDQDIDWQVLIAGKLYGFIPTNRQKLAPSTIKKAIQALQKGDILGIFPEATTGPVLRRPKKGVTYLSLKSGCKILPMGIIGLEEDIWSQWLKGVRPQVTVKIGKPFSISSSLPKGPQRASKQAIGNWR
jgi:1-acyl-sn-glycerol-3-phosphate acyltransferase